MASRSLLAGLTQGLGQALQLQQQQKEKEELKKLQVKLFKQQIEQKEKADEALNRITQMMGPQLPTDDIGAIGGGAPLKGKSLTDILADPEGQMTMLQSGMMKPADILKEQKPNVMQLLQQLTGGGAGGQGGAGGMELTGVKIGPNGQLMPDLARPKFKTEVPSGDGMSMIQLDEFGREMGRRPMGPGEQKAPTQTKGQTAVDTKFAEELVTFQAAGGYADVQKQLAQLREASKALGTETGLTGPVVGTVPEAVLKRTNPRAIAVRDAVLESVQRNLRLVLGAQFTQREGEMLLGRAYDPALPQAENKKRVDRLIKQIDSAAKAKQEAIRYFEEHGTLTGFKGKLEWSVEDFMPQANSKPSLRGPGKQNKVVDFSDLP